MFWSHVKLVDTSKSHVLSHTRTRAGCNSPVRPDVISFYQKSNRCWVNPMAEAAYATCPALFWNPRKRGLQNARGTGKLGAAECVFVLSVVPARIYLCRAHFLVPRAFTCAARIYLCRAHLLVPHDLKLFR